MNALRWGLALALTLAAPVALAQARDAGAPEGPAVGAEAPMPAMETAALSAHACLRALVRARVPFEPVTSGMAGVGVPVVVTGPIGGVTVRASRNRAVREPMDCALALGLVRFARLLRARHVREVRHLSIRRPAEGDELQRHPYLARHPGGLAIDAAVFALDDGTEYDVSRDFRGALDTPVCGPDARVVQTPGSVFLRSLFCDAARLGLFHVMLSPNFNDEHHNHFHLEITRSVQWRFVR
ncbi:MAG: extensin family protein [Polyangiales bacterium]